MAKQTFTTGQVLTAAQMTSLQQTAMGGGSTTAKTTSYVLTAADAGTVVAMNAAGATTITVNTGLFSAGDTVFIQNWGAGTCTVTAGTATVTTHGSLALGQWEGGTLYFTSASAAIFFDISQTSGMTNPMTTTGDMIYSSSGSTPARLGIGTAGQVLKVNSGATAPEWGAAGGTSGLTLIQRSTFTNVAGTGTTFDGVFTSTYVSYLVEIENLGAATGTDDLQIVLRASGADVTGHYGNSVQVAYNGATWTSTSSANVNQITICQDTASTSFPVNGQIFFNNVGQQIKVGSLNGSVFATQGASYALFFGNADSTSILTGFRLKSASSNVTGTVAVYGLAK